MLEESDLTGDAHIYPVDGTTADQGIDFGPNDPLPDIPDAGDDSIPITSPDPIDFSTKGITGAGAVGMSTFNDGNDETFFARTVDAFEEGGIESPMLGDDGSTPPDEASDSPIS
jgi:hypothetical protein